MIIKKYKGFTLVELLVVMAIIVLFGGAMITILFSLFRGANKTSTIINLREVGNYSVDQITRIVRDAKSLNDPDPSSCDGSAINSGSISLTTQDSNQDLQTTTLSCTTDGKLTVTTPAGTRTLIDGATVAASCSFACTLDGSSQAPIINFSLQVQQKDQDASVENKSTLNYSTSILMRNTE